MKHGCTHSGDGTAGRECRLHLRIPRRLLSEIDRAAGPGERSEWIRQAIEARLAGLRVSARRAELDRRLAELRRPGAAFFEMDGNTEGTGL
jgi:hypothetical protein